MAANSVGRVSDSRWDETVVAFEFQPMLRSAAASLAPVVYLHDGRLTDLRRLYSLLDDGESVTVKTDMAAAA